MNEVIHRGAWQALEQVYDGCCVERRISIVALGLVDELAIDDGQARLRLVLTTGWCPYSGEMLADAERRLLAVPGIDRVDVDVRWEKAWDRARMAPGLAERFRLLPDPQSAQDRDALLAGAKRGVAR